MPSMNKIAVDGFLGKVFLRKELDAPMTHEQADSNFSLLKFLVDSGILLVSNEGGAVYVEFDPLAAGGSEKIEDFVFYKDLPKEVLLQIEEALANSMNFKEFIKNSAEFYTEDVANAEYYPDTDSLYLPDAGRYIDIYGQVFDVATKKTLTYYKGALYEANGNVFKDFAAEYERSEEM